MVTKLIADGKNYILHNYKDEAEFESIVKEHYKEIFGEDSIWFDKEKLKSLSGIGSIPDGFVIDPKNKKFYIVEIELEEHPIYEHIVSQLSKFISGINNYDEKRKLASAIYGEVKEDSNIKNHIVNLIGDKEIYKILLDIISEPELIVIIDKKTGEVEEACNSLSKTPKIIEFKTYIRKDTNNVYAHLFDSLGEEKENSVVVTRLSEKSSGTEFTEKRRKLYDRLIERFKNEILLHDYEIKRNANDHWIQLKVGHRSGIHFEWGLDKTGLWGGLHLEKSNYEENKKILLELESSREQLEKQLNEKIDFNPHFSKKWCSLDIVNENMMKNTENTEQLENWVIDVTKKFCKFLKPKLDEILSKINK